MRNNESSPKALRVTITDLLFLNKPAQQIQFSPKCSPIQTIMIAKMGARSDHRPHSSSYPYDSPSSAPSKLFGPFYCTPYVFHVSIVAVIAEVYGACSPPGRPGFESRVQSKTFLFSLLTLKLSVSRKACKAVSPEVKW